MIILDTREPSHITDKLKLALNERIDHRALPAGDVLIARINTLPSTVAEYLAWTTLNLLKQQSIESVIADPVEAAVVSLMSQSIVVERKTPSDFLASLSDGRLFDQGDRLYTMAKYPMVLVTGFFYAKGDKVEVDGKDTGWLWWSVQMAIWRLQMAGVGVLQVPERYFGDAISHLWNWLWKGPTLVRNRAPQPLVPLTDEASFLCGIPGIGPEKANALMRYCGTPASALHFLTNPLSPTLEHRPEGFGKRTIENVREFMGIDGSDVLVATEIPKVEADEVEDV